MLERSKRKRNKIPSDTKATTERKSKEKEQSPTQRDLKVADHVRLGVLSLKNMRRKCAAPISKCDAPNWTEKLYTVSKIVTPKIRADRKTQEPIKYYLEDAKGQPPEKPERGYFRHELLFVDT